MTHATQDPSQPTKSADEFVFSQQKTEEYENENRGKRLKSRMLPSDDRTCHLLAPTIVWSESTSVNRVRADSFPNHIDRHGNRFWRHASILIAGLVVKPGFNKMIAGGGYDACLDSEFAAVYQKFLIGIDGQRKVGACRIVGACKAHS